MSGFRRLLACVTTALMINLAAGDLGLAADEPGAPPDSSAVDTSVVEPRTEVPAPRVSARETPLVTSDEGPAEEPAEQGAPFYKNRWLWGAAAGLLVATLVAVAAGGGEKAGHDLPDFPDPPAR